MNYYDYYDCEVMAEKIEELEELIKESNAMDTMLEGRNRTIAELENEFPMLNICDVMDWIYFTFCPILSYICLKFQQSGGGGGRLSNFKLFMSKASVICAGGGGGRLPCFKLYTVCLKFQ